MNSAFPKGPALRDAEGNCIDTRCTRMGTGDGPGIGRCIGWHCPYCDTPTGSQGHDCPKRKPAA